MTEHARRKPWRVVRQFSHQPDAELCTHRWERLAEMCARRQSLSRRHANEVGVHFAVRRPEATC